VLTTLEQFKPELEKVQNFVLQRIRRIQSLKDTPLPKDAIPPEDSSNSEDLSLRKWAKFYVKVAPDIKHKHHTIHEFVDNNGELFIEKDAQDIIDKKLLGYLPSFRNLDNAETVAK
jgi:predicted DNA-binding transcriptional regulator YafY